MKDVHVVILTPNEFKHYEKFERAILESIFVSDYNEKTQKAIVKIRKEVIEKFVKDNEAFAEIPSDEMEIVWE